ncbi:MAG TPA: Eco57I restriction-modification methylase domain-containing protein, partial [Tepidiformaceae bacterium]
CIANLSNDEVFTPPELANQMLDTLASEWAEANDGEDIWSNSSVTFLDPCTKTGVFLREITKRLIEGLASQMPDLGQRVDHILTKQVYGLAITELTGLLARRTLYCSKFADGQHSVATSFGSSEGNIWFDQQDHSWRRGSCTYCGASQSEFDRDGELEAHAYAFIHTADAQGRVPEFFGGKMQFDVVIGNPPYQLADGGGGNGTSAAPIYQLFVEQAKKLDPRYLSLVIPSRWFAGGKGLDDFRESMLADNRTRVIHDYWLVGDVFPGVAIQGGVCYFLWDREHPGACRVITHYDGKVLSSSTRPLMEPGSDVFIRYNEAISILKRIAAVENAADGSADTLALPEQKRFSRLVSSRNPFGLPSAFKVRATQRAGDVIAYWNGGPGFKKSGKGWVSRSDATDAGHLIDPWKVFIGKAYGDRGGGGASRDAPPKAVLGRPFVGEPGSVCTETYLCIGPLGSESEAANVCSYISCKLTRFLVMLQKPSQNTTKKTYTFVPQQDFTKPWTDAELYEKYGLSEDEIAFVEWMIRPMTLDGGHDEVEDLDE